MKYNVGSLFAGVGGICLGFKRANKDYNLVFANEIDDNACKTYSSNFNHNLIKGDIEKILNPTSLYNEREFLLKRLEELKEVENFNFDQKFVNSCIKSLNNSTFISLLMKNNFELTNSMKEKINYYGYNLESFQKYIEYSLITINLNTTYSELNVHKLYAELNSKKEEILADKIDVLTAGFPCQAFSIAGERKGFSDHRGELFYSVINLVKDLENKGYEKPRVLFLENVKNLVSHDNGNTFKVIKGELEKLGYLLKYKVLNTYKYTKLPQNRERIFIVCFLHKEDANNFGSFDDFNEILKEKEELKEELKNTLDYSITKETAPELYYTAEKYPNYFNINGINLNNEITEMFEIYQVRRGMYVRKNQSGVCPTLTANMGTGGHNVPLIKVKDGIRKLSPKDCFNLQGFRVSEEYVLPSSVPKSALYKQAGNAVSVDIIELIAKKIHNALSETDKLKLFY